MLHAPAADPSQSAVVVAPQGNPYIRDIILYTPRGISHPVNWAWMLWSSYALGTRAELWFGRGCCGERMLLEHERNYGLGHGCCGERIRLGMDALLIALIQR